MKSVVKTITLPVLLVLGVISSVAQADQNQKVSIVKPTDSIKHLPPGTKLVLTKDIIIKKGDFYTYLGGDYSTTQALHRKGSDPCVLQLKDEFRNLDADQVIRAGTVYKIAPVTSIFDADSIKVINDNRIDFIACDTLTGSITVEGLYDGIKESAVLKFPVEGPIEF